MKNWLLPFALLGTLAACSTSNESKQRANDTYQKSDEALPAFSPLASGGVNLPKVEATYQLPQIPVQRVENVDIRPPEIPRAIIHHSVAQFDGERAVIAYPAEKQDIYSLQQVARLFREQGVQTKQSGNKLTTDWAASGRSDEIGDVHLRYEIEQVKTKGYSALFVGLLQAKRDDQLFSPTRKDKQRYTSDRLNQLIGTLNHTYQKQAQDLNNSGFKPIQSVLTQDSNGRDALGLNATFTHAWTKLGQVLPRLDFDIKDEMVGRGTRKLAYRPSGRSKWWPFSGEAQAHLLARGTYYMQLSALGQQSAVVITDGEGRALPREKGQHLYQALQNALAQ